MYAQSNAVLILDRSSVTHNQAVFIGGGIAQGESAHVAIYSSTIAGNRTTLVYDGILHPFGGGIALPSGTLFVINSTIASNVSTSFDGGICNGLFTLVTAEIRNSIIAGNTSVSVGPDVLGPFTSGGYNLIDNPNNSTGFTNTGNQLNVNPLLGPLGIYGGPTLTMALRSGSPAIDKGNTFTRQEDQRGFARSLDDPNIPSASGGDGADIGSFEVDPNFYIVELRRTGSDVALSLMTVRSRNYRAEYTNDLASGTWAIFTNNAPGNGHLLWVTNSGGANQARRFYRGAIVPELSMSRKAGQASRLPKPRSGHPATWDAGQAGRLPGSLWVQRTDRVVCQLRWESRRRSPGRPGKRRTGSVGGTGCDFKAVVAKRFFAGC